MKKDWPNAATSQQRAATEALLRSLHSNYAGRILSAQLFGSSARGDFSADSDIDVLIVTAQLDPKVEWDIWGIGARVSLDFDVIFDLHVYSRAHWESLRAKGSTIWRSVEREGVDLKLEPVPA